MLLQVEYPLSEMLETRTVCFIDSGTLAYTWDMEPKGKGANDPGDGLGWWQHQPAPPLPPSRSMKPFQEAPFTGSHRRLFPEWPDEAPKASCPCEKGWTALWITPCCSKKWFSWLLLGATKCIPKDVPLLFGGGGRAALWSCVRPSPTGHATLEVSPWLGPPLAGLQLEKGPKSTYKIYVSIYTVYFILYFK